MTRYVSYDDGHRARVGVLEGDSVTPLVGVDSVAAGTDALAAAARDESATLPLSEAHLLPASTNPRRIFCVGLNYQSHIAETKRGDSDYPVLFPKFASNLIGVNDPIVAPPETFQLDWEVELAVVIGRPGRRISEGDAERHILGYTVANDVTMRDFQYLTHQWLQGKAWDDSTPLGPAIVTVDEADISSAGIRAALNGVEVQNSDLSKLIFSIPRLIAVISQFTRLDPGDVILTGTPGGVGFRRDPQVFLHPGDEIVVEVDGIGRITSRVEAESV